MVHVFPEFGTAEVIDGEGEEFVGIGPVLAWGEPDDVAEKVVALGLFGRFHVEPGLEFHGTREGLRAWRVWCYAVECMVNNSECRESADVR